MTAAASNAIACDIVSLRLYHCRAEQAARTEHYHLAVQQYRLCLESAEARQDIQAIRFFALKLADCYEAMGMRSRAQDFYVLAELEATVDL